MRKPSNQTLRIFSLILTGILIQARFFNILAQNDLAEGTYYIQNKEAGTFLSAGANYGTRAVLSPHGVDFKVTKSGSSYTLVTQIQGLSKALRPSDAYMDQSGTWTITPLDDGSWAMYNGTNYLGYVPNDEHNWIPRIDTYTDTSTDCTHWIFWTKEAFIDQLAGATADNPVDATFFIQAPDFLIGDYRISSSKVWGGDLSATGGITSGSDYTRNSGIAEKYEKASYNITQTLTGIPNGVYSVSVQAFYRNGSISSAATARSNGQEELLPVLYAGNKEVAIKSIFSEARSQGAYGGWSISSSYGYIPNTMSNAATCFNNGTSYMNKLTNVVVIDGTLKLGIRKDYKAVTADWCAFDNFTLLYFGEDIEALKTEALNEIENYETLNTDEDALYASSLESAKNAVNAATTSEEISKALEDVKYAYSIYYTKIEPDSTAIDLSSLLVNADLSQGITGWDSELDNNEGYNQQWSVTSSPNAVEAYAGYTYHELNSYSLTQTVTLSPGMYRLKAYSFYRWGTSYNSDIQNSDSRERSLAYLFAGKDSVKIARLGSLSLSSYANTLSEAATAFADGKYLNTLIFQLDEPQTLTLGYYGTHDRYRSWFVAGPVTLEKVSDTVLATESGDAFAVTKLEYALKWENWKTITSQAYDHSEYDSFVLKAKESLTNIDTEEQLAAKDAEVRAALINVIQNQTTPSGQFDITSLISNASFNKDLLGWTSQNSLTWSSYQLSEDFGHTSANVFQTLSNMPAGQYTLKVQAFYRPTTIGTSSRYYENGTSEVKAEMYLDDTSVKIQDINDDARYTSADPDDDVAGAYGHTVPNNLAGVKAAFELGQYWNVLRTEKNESGDITIGLRYDDALGSAWMPFDNFRLYYGAKTLDITLEDNSRFTLDEDTYANVTTQKMLKAGQLNAICVPFDIPADEFSAIYKLGGIIYDSSTKDAKGILVPTNEVKAGHGYYVTVDEDKLLKANDVLLHAQVPDSIPVQWENATMTGFYGLGSIRRGYVLGDNGNLEYKGVAALRQPGYIPVVTSKTVSATVKTIPLSIVDYDDVDVNINIENLKARAFLSDTKYSASTETKIANYNTCPPGRRDQPHTAILPIPDNNSASLQYVCDTIADLTNAKKIDLKSGTTEFEIKNFLPGHTYYYNVLADGESISKGKVTTEGNLRMIKLSSGNNFRDLGGWINSDGIRLKYGLLYRCGELNAAHTMSEEDIAEVKSLGICSELDLREDKDIDGYNITSSALGLDAPYLYVNQSMFGADALENDTLKYKDAFTFILDNLKHGRPTLFHCIWGADRTGAMAFLLEGLCGVTTDNIYKDYELTSYSNAGSRVKTGLDTKFDYINSLTGTSLQRRFFNYWNEKVHIDKESLCDFITIMCGKSTLVDEIRSEADAIKPVITNNSGYNYYDISGRKLTDKPHQPGVYIHNNKKM